MARWSSAVRPGLACALAAGCLFLLVNSVSRVNGVGLLARQAWPINTVWVWVAVGAVAGAIGGLIAETRRTAHARDARELTEAAGLEFSESYSLPDSARSMPVFAGWSTGRDAMTSHKHAVAVFDYQTILRDSESTTNREKTAALLPAPGLPAFSLHPRTLGRRMLGWAGLQGLTFDPESADLADAETVRRFASSFHLSLMDPLAVLATLSAESAPELTDWEEAVRRLFPPAVMERVNQYPAYGLQSHSGFLAVWCGSGILPARDRTELLDTALELHGLLTTLPAARVGSVIPARAGTDASRQARKYRNTLVGGVLGLFIGSILGSIGMSLVFFQPAAVRQGRFFLEALLFIGGAFAGAVLGAGMGSLIPVRELPPSPPEDPARRKSRILAIGIASVFGLFAGFFGGFVLFVASKIHIDWKFANFGIEAAIFFGTIFGGALVGAVTCGCLAKWYYR